MLFELVYGSYETGKIPQSFTKCIIKSIPKKAEANICEQYVTLSLFSHASKILTRIVLRRIENTMRETYCELKRKAEKCDSLAAVIAKKKKTAIKNVKCIK